MEGRGLPGRPARCTGRDQRGIKIAGPGERSVDAASAPRTHCAPMPLIDTVARNLRHERTRQRLTQTDLAEKAGLSVSYVSMLERGLRNPPLETLDMLAKALRVDPLSLLERGARK